MKGRQKKPSEETLYEKEKKHLLNKPWIVKVALVFLIIASLAAVSEHIEKIWGIGKKLAASEESVQAVKSGFSQTMVNSPNGIQAGRDIIVNQQPQVIQSIQLQIALYAKTSNTEKNKSGRDMGLGSVVALFTTNNIRIRFASDYMVDDEQIEGSVRVLTLKYTPESPEQILGKPIEFLSAIKIFAANYAWICKTEKFAQNSEETWMNVSLFVNGLPIFSKRLIVQPLGRLSAGQIEYDLSSLFEKVPSALKTTISQPPAVPER